MAQLISHGIKYGFPLRHKTAQDQHRFGGDRIDDLTNLLVVEQQIDELCHFQIVHSDYRLIDRCNH